jgi:formylglycine-generating enzyme required for sulfatase activity
MNETINPLAEWLDVHSAEPNHYELLGLPLFERDAERIRSNYLERYARVRQYQVGNYSEQALELLGHLSDALKCLDNAEAKRQYDAVLRLQLGMELESPFAPTAAPLDAELVLAKKPRRSARELIATTGRGVAYLPVRFDRGLRRLLGEENTLIFHFTRLMLYVAVPAVLIVIGWRNFPAISFDMFHGDELATGESESGSGSRDLGDGSKRTLSGATELRVRLEPPTAAIQAKLSGELDALIARQILDELTVEQKSRLARQVIRLADDAHDLPERRFVLLRKAARLAIDAKDDVLIASLAAVFGEEYDLGVSQTDESWLRQFVASGDLLSAASASNNSKETASSIENSIGMKLVRIPAGQFMMGSPDDEKDRDRDEVAHSVQITRPFYLSVYETTQQEFKDVLGRNPSWFSSSGGGKDKVAATNTDRFPVEKISWCDAVEFCNALSEKESLPPYYVLEGVTRDADGAITDISDVKIPGGRGYRLPTEAEWEYACRAGTTTPFHFGSLPTGNEANTNGYSYGAAGAGPNLARTAEVGAYSPNAFGLYDMHGNVWEWCQDWYGDTYYRSSPAEDPPGPDAGIHRVLRGGSWFNFPRNARAAYRFRSQPINRDHNLGFRMARSA